MGGGESKTLSAEQMKAIKEKDITVEEAEALKAQIAEMQREAQNLKAENEQLLAKEETNMFTFGVGRGLLGLGTVMVTARSGGGGGELVVLVLLVLLLLPVPPAIPPPSFSVSFLLLPVGNLPDISLCTPRPARNSRQAATDQTASLSSFASLGEGRARFATPWRRWRWKRESSMS